MINKEPEKKFFNNKELWEMVLSQIQFNISKANFSTWFKNTNILSKDNGTVVVSVPNSFSKEWLSNKYHSLILKILHNIDSKIKEIKYVVKTPSLEVKNIKKYHIAEEKFEDSQLKFEEFKIIKETNLNPRYTFNNFVVGSFNELAQAAAWAVSKSPGTIYNPLFVYGGVGLGKTHLLQAVGNKIVENFSTKKVKYLPCEKFISSIISSIKNQEIEKLKANLSLIEVLIIDDIQFLAGKDKTQEEFFHLFNTLYEKNKQIILSSDRPPNAIPEVEERLKSRFEGGMIADISTPDYETRLAILKTKLQEKNLELPEEVLEYTASNIKRNIRELEGALNRLLVFNKLNNRFPDLEVAKKLLKDYIFSPFSVVNFKKIVQAVVDFYELEENKLFEQTRKKEIVFPRQIAMFLLRKEAKYSFPTIARKFGDKDHTTAIYAVKKISQEIKKNNKLAEEINLIKQRIYSR